MDRKKKLHIHSDNSRFCGSENMPGLFLNDPIVNSHFDVTFSYRYSPEYEKGLEEWIGKDKRCIPLNFPFTNFLCKKRESLGRWIMALGYPGQLLEIDRLHSLFRYLEPDIVHCNNGGYPGASTVNSAAIAAGLLGIPVTYMANGPYRKRWWEFPLAWLLDEYVTKFVSAWDRDCFFRKEDNWVVIPNTVAPREIKVDKEAVRRAFLVKEDELLFLSLGVMEERKGHHILIDAWKELFQYKEKADATLIVAGEGSALYCLKLIQQRDVLEDSHRLKAWIYNLDSSFVPIKVNAYDLINACDVLVLPSLYDEDFPNALLIAIMMGKPVIASELVGIPDIVLTHWDGLLTRSGDSNSLKCAIEAMIEDKEGRENMGRNAAEAFKDRFSREIVMGRYVNLWKELV